MCLKCSAGLLGPESVVPHVMWHVMKKLTDSANQTESSQFHLNKRSMEIIAPVVHVSNVCACVCVCVYVCVCVCVSMSVSVCKQGCVGCVLDILVTTMLVLWEDGCV